MLVSWQSGLCIYQFIKKYLRNKFVPSHLSGAASPFLLNFYYKVYLLNEFVKNKLPFYLSAGWISFSPILLSFKYMDHIFLVKSVDSITSRNLEILKCPAEGKIHFLSLLIAEG